MNTTSENHTLECDDPVHIYETAFGLQIALPEWEAIIMAVTLSLVIVLTVIGNILVVLSVFTYKPLRIVQNFFIVSLAIADLTVALLVMPFNVAYSIFGRWDFGIILCKIWLTCDVLCCTASILNLCAIALDRFWAITDPINYAQKRTLKRVILMIGEVWVLSLIISSPPLVGWNDWPEVFTPDTPCQLTSERGYVIYSSLGSFYIPLFIMSIVYLRIFIATRKRLRDRAKASRINAMLSSGDKVTRQDEESVSSDTNNKNQNSENDKKKKSKKSKLKKAFLSSNQKQFKPGNYLSPLQQLEESVTDDPPRNSVENSTSSASGSQIAKSNKDEIDTTVKINIDDTTKIKAEDKNANNNGKSKKGLKHPGGQVYQFIEEKQKISLSKERRAARTLGIIMGVFVICWLPFFAMYVVLPFCPSCCVTKKMINFITWLGYANSALNPFIYTIFNLDFRCAFKKLLRIN